MSCCNKKVVNVENYANPPRSHYDQLMNKVYSPENQYFAAPFPMDRTDFDMRMQNRWCTLCGKPDVSSCPKCGYGFRDVNPTNGAPYPPLHPNMRNH